MDAEAAVPPGPILLLDSGVGGLSVATEVMRALPAAPLVYCADTAGFPYGTRDEQEIGARVPALLGLLAGRFRPSIIVIACNTASTIALAGVRQLLHVPIVGTVPAIKPAAERTLSGVIGVLGTAATVRQPYVDELSSRFAGHCTVLRHGSAALVEAAEEVLRGHDTPDELYARAMAGLLDQPGGAAMDEVVLACTHFPLLEDRLRQAAGRPLGFVHGAAGIARRTAQLAAGLVWQGAAQHRFVSTAAPDRALWPALAARGFAAMDAL